MKSGILFLCAAVFILTGSGCSKNPPPVQFEYPFSEVAKVYDVVVDTMATNYFSKYPELDRKHTAKLKAFILSQHPGDKFVSEIVRDKHAAIFEKARLDKAYRDTKEFKDCFGVIVNVAVPMAKMIAGGLCDIYVSAYIERDPVKIELFNMATSYDEKQFISWVYGEAAEPDFKKTAGNHDTKPGDRFFEFCSPESTWENMCGRRGFIQVRDRKILRVITTEMN